MVSRYRKQVGLIVAADEPALFFSSPETAQRYIEAADVKSGVYPEAYGSKGEIYSILSNEYDEVIVSKDEISAPKPNRLRELVENFLLTSKIDFPQDITLDDLIRICEPFVVDD